MTAPVNVLTSTSERETMEFDVLIVGGGPAGLATACRLAQAARSAALELSICLLEKGSEIGAHIVSGAILETTALDELFPDWRALGAPVTTAVTSEDVYYLPTASGKLRIPAALLPQDLHNHGNHVISLARLCRWLGSQAEALGVEILAGFPAVDVLRDDNGCVIGVVTGDQGLGKDGQPGPNHTPGYALHAKYTVFAEGCRGQLGKQLIRDFALDADCTPQHYGLGIKEVWEVEPAEHRPGHVVHSLGWPLAESGTTGGGFLYHMADNKIAVGLITDLNYENPWLSPFDEFQRMKQHPVFATVLRGGKRVSYGARALTKGGLQSLPRLVFPGGMLVGDDAGTLNFLKIKGTHTAMKSGMLAADSICAALHGDTPAQLDAYQQAFTASWLHEELQRSRNCAPAVHRFGTLAGAAYCFVDQLFKGKLPWTLRNSTPDHERLKPADHCARIHYPRPDNVLSFDRLSSVYLSNTFHEENQPCHLQLLDADTPIRFNLAQYDEPAQRYCPAGVYEIVRENEVPRLQINAQNCVHCKTCDIKDPTQNIRWVAPEGGGGPNYADM